MNKKTKGQVSSGWTMFLGVFSNIFSVALFALTIYAIVYFTENFYNLGKSYSTGTVGIDKEFTLEIDKPRSINDISEVLETNDIILSKWLIIIENLLLGDKNYMVKPGTYELNANMTSNEIMKVLYNNQTELATEKTIIIREGMTIKDIAKYLEENKILEADDFIDVANNGVFDYTFLSDIPQRNNYLEGYLFPDTYRVYAKSTPEQIINKMLFRFQEVYFSEYDALAKSQDLTMDQVITMASIIESEVMYAGEREKVSSVISNRLNQGMPLQMCSTVQYTLDKRRDVITLADLEIDTPYNTYKYGGLPIGPISNPGEMAIRAVLEPADTDYLYFVLKNKETGEHFFTSNYNEFLSAKEKYGQIY